MDLFGDGEGLNGHYYDEELDFGGEYDAPYNLPKTDKSSKKVKSCRWCGGSAKATSNNGVLGPGHAEWNFACKECGRMQ